VHLIPVNNMKEMDFNNPKVEMVKEEYAAIAMAIEATYNGV